MLYGAPHCVVEYHGLRVNAYATRSLNESSRSGRLLWEAFDAVRKPIVRSSIVDFA